MFNVLFSPSKVSKLENICLLQNIVNIEKYLHLQQIAHCVQCIIIKATLTNTSDYMQQIICVIFDKIYNTFKVSLLQLYIFINS